MPASQFLKQIVFSLVFVLLSNILLVSQDLFESEPNDQAVNADPVQVGQVIHGSISVTDVADYYSITLEHGGYLQLDIVKDPEFCGVWFLSILDAESGVETQIISANMYWLNAINSIGTHLLEGNYFIKVDGAQTTTNYQITVQLLNPALPEDEEPNNTHEEAIIIDPNLSNTGNVNSYAAGFGKDLYDWYKLVLDEDALVHLDIRDEPESWQAWWLYLLNGQKEGLPEIRKADLYWGTAITSLQAPLLKGVYFLKIGDASSYLNYRITPTLTQPFYASEPEPNNDTNTATLIPLNGTTTGTLRYYDPSNTWDMEDWYYFEIDQEGLMKFDMTNAVNNANFWVYLKDGNQTGEPVIKQVQFYWLNGNINKKFSSYLLPGKYYLHVANADRDFSYEVKTEFIPKPMADFEYEQVNNILVFNNQSLYGSSYLWDFGDETTSTATHPAHVYEQPGVFDVCLEVFNEGAQDSYCDLVTIEGISAVTPKSAGNSGYATISITGGGFTEDCKFRLEKNGVPTIEKDSVAQISRDALMLTLDLWGQETGVYDVIIETKEGERYILPESFTIELGAKPDPWVQIGGRDRILFNTASTYQIQYGNRGNVDAYLVPLWIAVSDVPGLEIEFTNAAFIDTLENEENPETLPEYIVTDTLFGEQKNMRIYPYILESIVAGSSDELLLKITTGEDIEMMVWVNDPFIQFKEFQNVSSPYGSQERDDEVSLNENVALCVALVLTEVYKNQNVELSEEQITCVLEYYFSFIQERIETLPDELIQAALKKGKKRKRIPLRQHKKFTEKIFKKCLDYDPSNENSEISQSVLLRVIRDQRRLTAKEVKSCLKEICPEDSRFAKQEDDCGNCGTFCQKNTSIKKLKAVNSLDPNEKSNLSGYSENNFIKYQATVPYTVFFENKDSATAPAHIVRIIDTLDRNKFDFNTFEFSSITIADSTIYPIPGMKKLLVDFNVPNINVIARFIGNFDTISGEVKWIIRSLDPLSFKDIEDPDIGFLPPNINKPEGEGNVSFYIDLKDNLQNKERIDNKAHIYFDYNDPIVTNVSTFSLDLGLPESTVSDLENEVADTLIPVFWEGEDLESGVQLYDIFVAENDGEFERWIARTNKTHAIFKGEIGNSYRFFSIAVDSVGLEESMPETWDAETRLVVRIEDLSLEETSIQVFPNPINSSLTLEFFTKESLNCQIYISSFIGTVVKDLSIVKTNSGYNRFDFDIESVPNGVYMLNINNGIKLFNRKIVLIH